MTYENDVLEIPKEIKEMSVAELEKAETELLIQLKRDKKNRPSRLGLSKSDRLKNLGIIMK
ncbi:MAG: hypothetical protein KBT19_08695 [Lachnospiraceae bacterium]|nr:hypothetical protein [Candidatus Colinaster equi]